MPKSKRRIRSIKAVIIGFYLILSVVIGSILIWFEIIHFEWSDWHLSKYKYEWSKNRSRRILVLGDSQLEKWPMWHCLYKDMERFCRMHDIGYVNAAHHGFGPIEYYDRLEYIAPDYHPSLIILFYYVGNDLTDVLFGNEQVPKKPTYDVVHIEGGSKARVNKEGIAPGFDWAFFEDKDIDPAVLEYGRNNALNPHLLVMSLWQPGYLLDNNTVQSTNSKYAWYKLLRKFEDVLDYAEQIQSEICIVAIPSTVQVDSSHFDFFRKVGFEVSDELMFSNVPQKLLYDFTSACGIKYLDLLPHFKEHPVTAGLYFENDDHLSTAGHKLAYKVVKEEILTWFLNRDETYIGKEREKDFYRNYKDWAIRYSIEGIKNDSGWLESVKEKAAISSISLDSMLFLDARYVVEEMDSARTLNGQAGE